MVGFAEVSVRPYAEGCRGERVAYLEGWFVAEGARGHGVGRALVEAAGGPAQAVAADARDPRAAISQPELRVVFSRDTQYHRLSVVEDADSRYLRFDNSLQSAMYLDDPLRTRFAYTDFFHLAKAYNADAERILRLVEVLEELDDVSKVFSNFDIDAAQLAGPPTHVRPRTADHANPISDSAAMNSSRPSHIWRM